MNLIEKEKILRWAKSYANKYSFPAIDRNKDSYYQDYGDGNNIYEYGFESIAELKRCLEEMWKKNEMCQELSMVCAVGAYKEKPVDNKFKDEDMNDEISPYIYPL